MLVEGVREAALALANGFVPEEAYICPELIKGAEATAVADRLLYLEKEGHVDLFTITPELFAKVAYRGESGGVLLVIPYWSRPLASLLLPPNPFLVIIEGGEKPGNLGAIHLAVWVGIDQAQARVDAALAAGGKLVRDDYAPAWWTLADAYGNEVDVATVEYRDEPLPG